MIYKDKIMQDYKLIKRNNYGLYKPCVYYVKYLMLYKLLNIIFGFKEIPQFKNEINL